MLDLILEIEAFGVIIRIQNSNYCIQGCCWNLFISHHAQENYAGTPFYRQRSWTAQENHGGRLLAVLASLGGPGTSVFTSNTCVLFNKPSLRLCLTCV